MTDYTSGKTGAAIDAAVDGFEELVGTGYAGYLKPSVGVYLGGGGAANLLAEYEEGTWTPSIGGTATYLAQTGTYTKVGRIVHFTAVVYVNAIGTGSPSVITGLPFSLTGSGGATASVPAYGGLAISVTHLSPNISGTTITIGGSTAASASNQAALSVMASTTYLEISGTYQAA